MTRKQADPNRVLHVGHRAAWKWYIRGNVVSESSVTFIANILSACSAMQHHEEDDDERNEDEEQQDQAPPWLAVLRLYLCTKFNSSLLECPSR